MRGLVGWVVSRDVCSSLTAFIIWGGGALSGRRGGLGGLRGVLVGSFARREERRGGVGMLVCLRARVKTTECELALSFPENNRRTMARRRRCWWDVGCQEQKVDTFLTFLSVLSTISGRFPDRVVSGPKFLTQFLTCQGKKKHFSWTNSAQRSHQVRNFGQIPDCVRNLSQSFDFFLTFWMLVI